MKTRFINFKIKKMIGNFYLGIKDYLLNKSYVYV